MVSIAEQLDGGSLNLEQSSVAIFLYGVSYKQLIFGPLFLGGCRPLSLIQKSGVNPVQFGWLLALSGALGFAGSALFNGHLINKEDAQSEAGIGISNANSSSSGTLAIATYSPSPPNGG